VTRAERRALVRETRKRAAARPSHLVDVPESDWPGTQGGERPIAVWLSQAYLVVSYPAPSFGGVEVRRLSVNRATVGIDGRWDQNIPWEDLQRIKRETGHGDWYAVEVYPRDRDVVNIANMRHLWLMATPLDIGWFA
jgi:hypothetical protein